MKRISILLIAYTLLATILAEAKTVTVINDSQAKLELTINGNIKHTLPKGTADKPTITRIENWPDHVATLKIHQASAWYGLKSKTDILTDKMQDETDLDKYSTYTITHNRLSPKRSFIIFSVDAKEDLEDKKAELAAEVW
jgi:uncharacterized protein YycO